MDTYSIEPIPNPREEGVVDLLRGIRATLQTVEELVRDAQKPLPVILIDE
jgi:hypothetical protein